MLLSNLGIHGENDKEWFLKFFSKYELGLY